MEAQQQSFKLGLEVDSPEFAGRGRAAPAGRVLCEAVCVQHDETAFVCAVASRPFLMFSLGKLHYGKAVAAASNPDIEMETQFFPVAKALQPGQKGAFACPLHADENAPP